MTNSVDLTVLTDPIPIGRYFFSESIKFLGRKVRNYYRPPPIYLRSQYRGHFAVTRSLVEGLRSIGASFNYNPNSLTNVSETVVVLSGTATLKQAIKLKRTGCIKKILAGPNLVVFPSDERKLFCAPEIDICITPNPLISKLYIDDCPDLQGRCIAWPAGVNTDYWKPDPSVKRENKVIIYEKQHGAGVIGHIANYESILERRGYQVEKITYGQYLQEDYLHLLQQASLMIGFSPSESQGIAWSEAWSTNVPLLAWCQEHYTYRGRTFKSSSAPYLTDRTGLFFSTLGEFEKQLTYWEEKRDSFQPRNWIMESMSDVVCAKKLCQIVESLR